MEINAKLVKELRERTGAGMMDCKKALEQANGDMDKAIEKLREMGLASARKKSLRVANEGKIVSYIHAGGKIGVMVELNCETDFVANTDEFTQLAKDIAMHIAATNPLYIDKESVPQEVIEKEKAFQKEQLLKSGKPENVLDKILEGKINKYLEDICVLDQPFVKNETLKVKDLIDNAIAKFGENIVLRRFVRFKLGEE